MRRVAAHIVNVQGQRLRQAVVEIDNGNVAAWHTLAGEEPMTEWLGGTIDIVPADNGTLLALHSTTVSNDEQDRRAPAQEESCTDTQQEGPLRVLLR